MTDAEFEEELQARLHRAAEQADEPAARRASPAERSEPAHQRWVRAPWVAGVAAAIVLLVVGAVILQSNEPHDLVTTDSQAPALGGDETQGPSNADTLSGLLPPDTVRVMATAPFEGRIAPAYTWTGSELLIWGGSQPRPGSGEDTLADGAAYDPTTDTWRLLSDAPIVGRTYPSVVWTGTEMIVWGGGANGDLLNDGAAYDPETDTWRRVSASPLDGAMKSGVVWTGVEMLIVGGLNGDSSGGAYDPVADSWRLLPDAPGLVTPPYPQAVWSGTKAYFVLDSDGNQTSTVFASYDPASNEWQPIPHEFGSNRLPFLVWTGAEIVGITTASGVPQQAYDPATEAWRELPPIPEDLERAATSSPLPWTADEVLLWSGGTSGLALDPETESWRNFPAGDLTGRVGGTLIWADGVMLAWGGFVSQPDGTAIGADDGVVYAPPNETAEQTSANLESIDEVAGTLDEIEPCGMATLAGIRTDARNWTDTGDALALTISPTGDCRLDDVGVAIFSGQASPAPVSPSDPDTTPRTIRDGESIVISVKDTGDVECRPQTPDGADAGMMFLEIGDYLAQSRRLYPINPSCEYSYTVETVDGAPLPAFPPCDLNSGLVNGEPRDYAGTRNTTFLNSGTQDCRIDRVEVEGVTPSGELVPFTDYGDGSVPGIPTNVLPTVLGPGRGIAVLLVSRPTCLPPSTEIESTVIRVAGHQIELPTEATDGCKGSYNVQLVDAG